VPASAALSQSSAATAAASVVGGSRASAYAAYQNVLKPALAVPIGWSGSIAGCNAGAPSAAAQEATRTAVNYYRDMAGLPLVAFDSALSAKAQQAALMMSANQKIDHYPPNTWTCYSQVGYDAAGKSNLALGYGAAGAGAVALYMDDRPDPTRPDGVVGHRRWILYPPQSIMGSGSTSDANALYVQGSQTAPASPPAWVEWPSSGYVPLQVEPGGHWSLGATNPGTDFSNAQVSVTKGGVSLPVTKRPLAPGYGNPTLVWDVNPGYGPVRADQAYNVSVTNIIQNGVAVSHQYTVTLFDGNIDADQAISFPVLAGRVYGDPASTAAATASSGLPVAFTSTTTAVCTTGGTNGATITLVGTGTCSIRADQPGDAIRNPAPPVSRSFTVAKKALTVRPADVVRPVGAPNPAFTATYSGFAYGQTFATSGIAGAPTCSTTATQASPAGTYPISCGVGTLTSANYSFSLVPGSLTVAHTYVPLSPARLVDTRAGATTVDGAFAGGGTLGSATSVNVTVTGRGGVPATGVGAVVLNVTATGPTASSFLSVWPAGEARPNASNLNVVAGQTVPNLVIAKVGANGQVSVYNHSGSTHLVVDVAGWFPQAG